MPQNKIKSAERAIYCYRHDDAEIDGVLMERDLAALRYYCPHEGCDHAYTYEEILEQSCQRCGEGPDGDLRTLWMACLYEMRELGLPFEQFAIKGVPQRVSGYEPSPFYADGIPQFEPVPDAGEYLYRYYLLRVCKGCRAEWMGAIATWFKAERDPQMDSSGNYALTKEQAEAHFGVKL